MNEFTNLSNAAQYKMSWNFHCVILKLLRVSGHTDVLKPIGAVFQEFKMYQQSLSFFFYCYLGRVGCFTQFLHGIGWK